jgi:hypothetical protein
MNQLTIINMTILLISGNAYTEARYKTKVFGPKLGPKVGWKEQTVNTLLTPNMKHLN